MTEIPAPRETDIKCTPDRADLSIHSHHRSPPTTSSHPESQRSLQRKERRRQINQDLDISAEKMQGPTSSSQPQPSSSPSQQSLGEKISALGLRLTRTLSHSKEYREDDVCSLASTRPPSYSESESLFKTISFDCTLCGGIRRRSL